MENEAKIKGPGRPTSKKKDTVIRLRIDSEAHKKIFAYAKEKQVTVSELIREMVYKMIEENDNNTGEN